MTDRLVPTHSAQDSRTYVNGLLKEAENHRALHHPYLEALVEGNLPDSQGAVRDLCHQYLAYSENFLQYLSATVSLLDERKHRDPLLSNMMEENGVYPNGDAAALGKHGIEMEWINQVPHPVLFKRFLDSLGMDDAWRHDHPYCDEAVIWGQLFFQCCRSGGAAQAIGAMGIGTECIVKQVYRPILAAIVGQLDVAPRDRVFFDLHAAVDDDHGEILQNIAADLAAFGCQRPLLRRGVLMALNLRTSFFDGMLIRTRTMTAANKPLAARSVDHCEASRALGSESFTTTSVNRDSLVPVPAKISGELVHRAVCGGGEAAAYSTSRGHPVFPVKLTTHTLSMSIGDLDPGEATSKHRHAYESLIYVIEGEGFSTIEGQKVLWKAGDALYVPVWNWHQHFCTGDARARYITGTNLPLLYRLGQTVLREEQQTRSAAGCGGS
ncbi:MAG: iron-containing redox enzyme family protein [Nannocystaceae bacterium]